MRLTARIGGEADERTLVAVGDLDSASAEDLERAVLALYASGAPRVLIDLRGVEFMDSTGLRALLSLRNGAKRINCELTLVPGAPAVERVFRLTATRGLFAWRD